MTLDLQKYYPVPCEVCGQGILRTGKRGRPPKRHKELCVSEVVASRPRDGSPFQAPHRGRPTDEAKVANAVIIAEAADDGDDDPDIKTVNEFLLADKKDKPRARVSEGYADRISMLARKLEIGDSLYLKNQRSFYIVTDVKEVGEHMEVRLDGLEHGQSPGRKQTHDMLRIIADGEVLIAPR